MPERLLEAQRKTDCIPENGYHVLEDLCKSTMLSDKYTDKDRKHYFCGYLDE